TSFSRDWSSDVCSSDLEYMEVPFLHLRHAGVDVFRNSRSVYVGPKCVSSAGIQPFEVSCGTYPGVISDMQPFYVLLGLFANGIRSEERRVGKSDYVGFL